GEAEHARLLRGGGFARAERAREAGARVARRRARRLIQDGGGGPARVAGDQDHAPAPGARSRPRLLGRFRARAPGFRPPDRVARERADRLRRRDHRHGPPRARRAARPPAGAARGRLPRRDAGDRGAEPRAAVVASRKATKGGDVTFPSPSFASVYAPFARCRGVGRIPLVYRPLFAQPRERARFRRRVLQHWIVTAARPPFVAHPAGSAARQTPELNGRPAGTRT